MRLVPLPGVFKPPSDARMLADCVRGELRRPGMSALDLCTGSGFLALVAAKAGAADVTAVDVSRRAVVAVRLNSRLNAVKVHAIRGDLFQPLAGGRFDVIVSNPPYLPSPGDALPERGIARATEAGPSGRGFVDRICAGAPAHLNEGGSLLLVHSSVCGERRTLDALRGAGLMAEVVLRKRGPLGPMLRARVDWLRRQGLLLANDEEEILVFRARRDGGRHPSGDAADRHRRTRIAAG